MIAVLCGGVGAARLLAGLVDVVDASEIVAIVNTADDLEWFGLHVSPDLDTITYTLAHANADTGWGLQGETWQTIGSLARYGAPTWFQVGDTDLATHLFRTGRLKEGATLTEVTAEIVRAWGLELTLLPMTDDAVRTRLRRRGGDEVAFQEYFVKLGHSVEVEAVRFDGVDRAVPGPQVLATLDAAEVIVIAPSNPVVSIAPILAVPGIADALARVRRRVVAVSPIVGGSALKGPADRLLTELGGESSVVGVARRLADVCGTLVIDDRDAELAQRVAAVGVEPVVTDTVMVSARVAAALARVVLAAGGAGAASDPDDGGPGTAGAR